MSRSDQGASGLRHLDPQSAAGTKRAAQSAPTLARKAPGVSHRDLDGARTGHGGAADTGGGVGRSTGARQRSPRRRSVGTVVLCAALEDAFTRGLNEFDLLRGAERYKALYASSSRPIVTFRVAAETRARALCFADRARRARRGSGWRVPTPVRNPRSQSSRGSKPAPGLARGAARNT